jgi:hypothetical protein
MLVRWMHINACRNARNPVDHSMQPPIYTWFVLWVEKKFFCKLIEVDKLIEPLIQSIEFFKYIKIPKYNYKHTFKNMF